ncbi:hypothetical protein ACU5AY_05955 [Rhizobium sp. PAMB 3174]
MARLFDDPFTFMVEELDRNGKAVERLAGADNIIAARAAFNALVVQYGDRPFILRHRGRIIERANLSQPPA